MGTKNDLQDMALSKLQKKRQVVTVITTNGFKMKGRITAFDRHMVAVEIRNEQQFVYKHAISTIAPDSPIDLEELEEEARI